MSFLYSILPEYTKNIDILTDTNINGEVKVLEEYLNVIDREVFDIISNTIKEIVDFRDIYNIKTEYLPYFAYLLGYSWNSYVDESLQRQLVAGILQLYKRKGTKFSFHFSLYQLDPGIKIYEPYKDIFILSRSNLGTKHLTSHNYYSPGIVVLKITNYDPMIFELFEMVRPAGWKIIVEGRYGIFYNIHIKPETKIRELYLRDRYTVTDPRNEEQVQYINSIHYVNDWACPVAMVGHTMFTISMFTIEDLAYMTIVYPETFIVPNTTNKVSRNLTLWELPCNYYTDSDTIQYLNINILPQLVTMVGRTLLTESMFTINDMAYMTILYPETINIDNSTNLISQNLTLRKLSCNYSDYISTDV